LSAVQDRLGLVTARADRYHRFLRCGAGKSQELLLLILDVARASRDAATEHAASVELAWTYPAALGLSVRPTGAVAREVIRGARHRVMVVGYSVTVDANLAGLAARTIAELGHAAERGAVVTAILNREPANRAALLKGWPSSQPEPTILTWPERPGDPKASLHAKVLIADRRDALITSANLTYHGFEANVEFGVRVQGADAAAQMLDLFDELIRRREFVAWPD
jgi:phosphatidylserine/phosphatidylglycerophosphate/cardiolipin synthase-like enzyme